jgi:hypothetical protein
MNFQRKIKAPPALSRTRYPSQPAPENSVTMEPFFYRLEGACQPKETRAPIRISIGRDLVSAVSPFAMSATGQNKNSRILESGTVFLPRFHLLHAA